MPWYTPVALTMIALLAEPSGTLSRKSPTVIEYGTVTKSRRMIRAAVRLSIQPMSRGDRISDPRTCSRQVENE